MFILSLFLASATLGLHSHRSYVEAWKKIESGISHGYYARKTREKEMNALLAKYKPLAEMATSDEEFADRVEAMIKEFGDSHFDFYTKANQGYYAMDGLVKGENASKMPGIGAWFKQTAAGYQVQMVIEKSRASQAGLRPGDLMETVDTRPFEPVTSFEVKPPKKVHLEWSRAGRTLSADLEPQEVLPLREFLDATNTSVHIINVGKKKIGYIHVWTFGTEKFKEALANAVAGTLSKTDGFILDIRDGFGGRPEGYADPFFRPDVLIKWSGSNYSYDQHFGYGRPLVLLINHGSRSAKEMLAYVLKSSHRATLIGTTTAGNVLGTSPVPVGDWAYLEMPLVDVLMDGHRLEKKGVSPDIMVDPELGPNGEDRVLDEAVKFLGKKVK